MNGIAGSRKNGSEVSNTNENGSVGWRKKTRSEMQTLGTLGHLQGPRGIRFHDDILIPL